MARLLPRQMNFQISARAACGIRATFKLRQRALGVDALLGALETACQSLCDHACDGRIRP